MLEVGNAQGGILEVLEKRDLVADVVGSVVERGGADEDDFLAGVAAAGQFALGRCLANALEFVKCLGGVVAEFVGFVNDHQIESFRVSDFVQAAVGHKLDVVEPE